MSEKVTSAETHAMKPRRRAAGAVIFFSAYLTISMLGGLLYFSSSNSQLNGIELLSPGRWRIVHTNAIAYGPNAF
jgi:hypothetical protein